jgi:hypothetical protein
MIRRTILLAPCAFAACAGATAPDTEPRVHISVSVDWEGRDLSDANLAAFADFRAAHPEVPLTQFINAAYFDKADADAAQVSARIRQALQPHDELGLHIHPWKSLVEAAGVTFRSTPTIWGIERPERKNWPDPGHDVSVEAYTVDEFQKIVAHSKAVLDANGFSLSNSFRAGAWLAGPRVLEAIRREGFVVDASATDTKWHTKIAQFALPQMIRDIWPDVTADTQPFYISTPAGDVLEIPDTGALADYVTAEQMAGHIADAVNKLDGHDLYVHIGFHQETAATYIGRVIEALSIVKEKHADHLVFETLEQSANSLDN